MAILKTPTNLGAEKNTERERERNVSEHSFKHDKSSEVVENGVFSDSQWVRFFNRSWESVDSRQT